MPLLTLLVFATPATLGISVFAYYKLAPEKVVLCLLGTVAGLSVATTLLYASTLLIPLGLPSLLILVAICFAGTGYFISHPQTTQHLKNIPTDTIALGVLILTVALFAIIAPKLLMQKEDGLYTGIINAYGDIAWHTSLITTFAAGQSFPPQDPSFAGTRLVYPFLTDFLSAALLKSGASLPLSVNLLGLTLIPLLLTLLYCFTRELTASRGAGVITLVLFLCGGATLGFIRFPADWQTSGQPLLTFLQHLPNRDYSGVGVDAQGFHFLNPVTTLLLPQRSFMFGIPLSLGILLLLWWGSTSHQSTRAPFIAAGMLSGVLPLFHAHTVLTTGAAAIALLSLAKHKKPWVWYFLTAFIVGLPEVLFYLTDFGEGSAFARYAPGWTKGSHNFFLFWLKNTGLLLPIVLTGLVVPKLRTKTGNPARALAVAAVAIFVVANIFLFAPWAWDNFKLLVFWLIFSLPLLSYLATRALTSRHGLLVTTAILLILLHSLSGALDVWKLSLPTAPAWLEWNDAGRAAARIIQANTNPGDSIVTASIHNSPVTLAGRLHYLAFAAHVWSHGRSPWNREKAVAAFYTGQRSTLPETNYQYVVVGPDEKNKYPALTIASTWSLVATSGPYQLFAIAAR